MTVIKGAGVGGGKGGGGSARAPQESPDSLRNTSYAVVMDIISNGEISGFLNNDFPLQNIYLDGTPIQNSDLSANFNNVFLEFRPGTSNQEHVDGFQLSANISNDGREIKVGTPWVQSVSNPNLSAVRLNVRLPQLVKTITSGEKIGDRVGSSVTIAIDVSVGGGAYQEVIEDKISGKTTSGYTRTYRVNLPENTSGTGWTIRVRRLTPDSTSDTLLNKTFMQSYVEVVDGKFSYPMTAYAVIKVNAEHFQGIPARGYHIKGKIIKIPSNYDPDSRSYTGVWDGTFKNAWTDNPAWIYYDILTNSLYGLGDRVNASMVDRYALYQIGAYCDQLVDDGKGGQEPRFTCNVYIQGQQDALRVLNDLTSTFRGMSYWAAGQIMPSADMPSDPVYTFTNANVIDGIFTYTGANQDTMKTVALVSYNDPTDFYRSKVEVVEDDDGILRYGVRKTEINAFGCTSRGQAQRVGLYHLYTSRMESGGVSFSVGLDGVIPQPGSIVQIADRNRAGRRIGGRVHSATNSKVTLDKADEVKVGDSITVILPSGKPEKRIVSVIDGNDITVSVDFTLTPEQDAVWSINSSDLVTQPIRVVSVRETGGITFDIEGIFHHPDKYDAIDDGVRLDPLPVSVVPPRAQQPPTNIVISEYHTFHQGTTRHNAEITWDRPDNAATYDVQWRRDNSDWIPMVRSGDTLRELLDIHAGDYTVRVRAINALEVPSLWAYSAVTTLQGLASAPTPVASLTATSEVMAIRLDWAYSSGQNIVSFIQIRASLTNSFDDSYEVTNVAYPATSYTMQGLMHGVEMWFWIRLIDKNGLHGPWYPSSTAVGIYGKSSTDSDEILSYLEKQIGEGELAPGLIEEIQADVAEGIADEILGEVFEDILGDLTGDITSDMRWFAGDVDSGYVGTVTTTSAFNHGDLLEANRTVTLAARLDDNIAVIKQEQTVQATNISANASQITTLAASTDASISAIKIEQSVMSNEISSNASNITTLASQTNSSIGAIQSELNTHTNEISANASNITTLAARTSTAEANIIETSEALSSLDGKLKASWQVKTQVRSDGRVVQAGVALGASIDPSGTSRSEFLVMADTVAFVNKINGALHAPFVFNTVNDTMVLNNAIIGNASIGSAKFANVTASDATVGGSPVLSINWRTGVMSWRSITSADESTFGGNFWTVKDRSSGVVVLEIDAR